MTYNAGPDLPAEMTPEQLKQWYSVNKNVLQDIKDYLLATAENIDVMIIRYTQEELRLKLQIANKKNATE